MVYIKYRKKNTPSLYISPFIIIIYIILWCNTNWLLPIQDFIFTLFVTEALIPDISPL